MNTLIKNKKTRWILAAAVGLVILLLYATPAISKVDANKLSHCTDIAFSTSEDFITHGPTPSDGDPYISDGDLLGLNWATCARNAELLATFNITDDLGLDAVDVINIDNFVVAFSTELDSPSTGPAFTSGDLLTTNGAIIPNQALTNAFADGGIPYDLGLDAVHFIGEIESIDAFIDEAVQVAREEWFSPPDRLENMLLTNNIDIWFSTEGTYTPAKPPGFLDGDLLSAATGTVQVYQDQLLPISVPAGIPVRGVDFGLDAVTSDRSFETDNVHFSTEILFNGEFNFTDGDLLQINSSVIAVNSADLVNYYQPPATMLGLDAVWIGKQAEQGCVSRITKINGVDVADIDLTTGMINPGVLGFNAPAPFGGTFDIQGTVCDDVERFKVVYRSNPSDPWEVIKVNASKNWKVKEDAFFPPIPDCLGLRVWNSGTNGWFDGPDYRHLEDATLGGCNTGLALTVWESDLVSGGDELYELVFVTETAGGVFSDTLRTVQLDNTTPTVELEKVAGICNSFSTTNITVVGRMQDEYFYAYQVKISGDGYGTFPYTKTAYFDDPTDQVIATGTMSWASYVDIQDIDLTDLTPSPVACGYSVLLRGWDRTHVGSFIFPSNLPGRCSGCRYTDDLWAFSYSP